MSDGIIIRTKVKEAIGDLNLGGDFVDALNRKVEAIVKEACERAKANGRRTVMAKDL
ncbi:MAG TPA: DUF1931 domain-containing protein [Candidatus Nanoarchaeia archaeon]|nr:DUF1931 domain-containing protein [Candidatus Nanoarchaeia archaeon]